MGSGDDVNDKDVGFPLDHQIGLVGVTAPPKGDRPAAPGRHCGVHVQ